MISYGSAALRGLVETLETTASHTTVFAVAARAGSLVAGDLLEEDQVWQVLLPAALEARAGSSDTPGKVRKTLADGLQRGRQHPAVRPEERVIRDTRDAVLAIVEWRDAQQADLPTGRRAGSYVKILDAMYLLALSAGSTKFAASHREIAETAGVSPQSVTNALEGLKPWITRRHTGTRWRYTDSRSEWILANVRNVDRAFALSKYPDCPNFVRSSGSLEGLDRPDNDAWAGRSPNMYRVWQVLDVEETVTVKAVAEELLLTERTVRLLLAEMVRTGLAVSDGDRPAGWRQDPTAGSWGMLDAAVKHMKHEDDREILKEARARYFGGEGWELEQRFVKSDRELPVLEVSESDGSVLRAVLASLPDPGDADAVDRFEVVRQAQRVMRSAARRKGRKGQ